MTTRRPVNGESAGKAKECGHFCAAQGTANRGRPLQNWRCMPINRASLASIKPCIEPALCVGSMPALTDSMGTVLAFKCEPMARIALTALTAGAAGRPIYSEMK